MKNLQQKNENRFLFDICRPYRGQIFIFIVLSSITSLLDGISIGLLIPLLGALQQVGDYEQLPGILHWLVSLFHGFSLEQQLIYSVCSIVLVVLLKNIFLSCSLWIGFRTGSKIASDTRSKVIKTILDVNIEYFNKVQAGKIIDSALSHTVLLQSLFESGVRFVVNFLTLCSLLILLLVFSWKLTLATFLFGTVIILLISQYTKKVKKLAKKRAYDQQGFSALLHELVSGIYVIKSFSKESDLLGKLQQKINNFQQSSYQTQLANSQVLVLTESLSVFIIGIIFVIAIMWHAESSLLLLQILPFFYILVRMVPHIKGINHDRSSIISQWPSLELVSDLIRRDNKPFMQVGEVPFQSLQSSIRFDSVSFYYEAENHKVLKQIDLSIPCGKTTAIVGESGSGKSTLVNLLLRFYDPQKGTIWIDNVPLTKLKLNTYRRKIGIVSQDTFIFNDSVKNNIAFGALTQSNDASIFDAAEKANADVFIQQLPDGYDTLLGDRGVKLSGGQRQRIAIARAIIKDPEILILDEASSSLDNQTERLVHQALANLRKNRTIIIIAHRLSTIQGADQIVVLKEGRIIESGDESQLLKLKGAYYHLTLA